MMIECKRLGLISEPKRRIKNMTCDLFARTGRRLRLKGSQNDWLKFYRVLYKNSSVEEEVEEEMEEEVDNSALDEDQNKGGLEGLEEETSK